MSDPPEVVRSVAGLDRSVGRLAVSVGVFDGLHLGHAHLLDGLTRQARAWAARPAVVTFDAHPDAILRGEAPPMLLDPVDRLTLLGEAGIEVIVVEHFDDRLRTTTYDDFVRGIAERVELAGFVMTPDAAFGHERRGTPDALRALGSRTLSPFQVAVVPPFGVNGRAVSSSEIRRLVAAGDLAAAERLLGRPYAVVGRYDPGSGRLAFELPVALPPPGDYAARVGAQHGRIRIEPGGTVALDVVPPSAGATVRVVFGRHSAARFSSPASVARKPHRS